MDRHGRVRKHSYSGVLNGYDGGKEGVAKLWVDCRWCFYSDRRLASDPLW